MATLGQFEERASAYGRLRSDARHIRLLLQENVNDDFYKVLTEGRLPNPGSGARRVDLAIVNAVAEIPPSTRPDILSFAPPPEDERYLREIRAKGAELSKVMKEIITVAPERVPRSLRIRAERMAVALNQLATELENRTSAWTNPVIAQNASAYTGSRNLFIGAATGAMVLALLLGFVLRGPLSGHPADRRPARRDRLRELLGARGRDQPGRARRARGQREPDGRRAPPCLQGAGDHQRAQVGVPGQHVA